MTIFSIILACGSVLGLVWINLSPVGGDSDARLNAGIWALLGALLGARLAYVSVNWPYFQTHPFEIVQPWLGGLSWIGAFAGGLLAIALSAWVFGLPLDFLMDDLLPLLASLSVATWLGCWLTGCAYGPESNLGIPTRDEWGIWRNRFPVQLIAALAVIVLFWGIEQIRNREWGGTPGLAASLGVGGLSLILLGASIFRADPYPLYNGIRLETWGAFIFLGISLLSGILVIVLNRR